jgi:hypothetical protein
MDYELIVAAILREREADRARLDRIRRARPQGADAAPGAPVASRPRLLQRVARALSLRRDGAGRRKLETGG